ncbi:hypothetical protein EV192_120116 [Actinocrispum wychmicini]|uniref:Uncharacterized protein n=1 Tax=Actinocrispum wychmicini TaxID=1213861 RepID=A0A4V2S3Z4_9PSEU|nr:hypothetical protein EV192_120116 [Actinocrispum wychmicini]
MTGTPIRPRWWRITHRGSPATRDTKIMTNPHLDSNAEPGQVEPFPTDRSSPLAESQDRRQQRWDRIRTVRISCTIVSAICGLFAVVLVAHIIMVLGEANPANGVASFVRGFAAAVSLGFDGLFTPASVKAQVLLNYGSAAVVWLVFAVVVTALIRRFALPGPSGLTR